MKKLFFILLVLSTCYSKQIGISVSIPYISPSRGLLGLDYTPTSSSFTYQMFMNPIQLNTEVGGGYRYSFFEEYLNVFQTAYWLFGANAEIGHVLGFNSGLGLQYQADWGGGIFLDFGIPIYLNESGIYTEIKDESQLSNENYVIQFGTGLRYVF